MFALTGSPDGGAVELPSLGSLGVAGALVLVIIYLLSANRTDRAQYREALAAVQTQHQAEMAALRQRVDDLEREIDRERDERRTAQDHAATARLRADAAESRLSRIPTRHGGDARRVEPYPPA